MIFDSEEVFSEISINESNLLVATFSVYYNREIREQIIIKIRFISVSYFDVSGNLILPSREVRQRFETFSIESGCTRVAVGAKSKRSIGAPRWPAPPYQLYLDISLLLIYTSFVVRTRGINTVKYGLLTKCEVKMAGYWQSSLFAWAETKLRSINSRNRTRPISSHFDRTQLRWPNITTCGKYPYVCVMPERYFVFICCSANASISASTTKKNSFDPRACVKAVFTVKWKLLYFIELVLCFASENQVLASANSKHKQARTAEHKHKNTDKLKITKMNTSPPRLLNNIREL